MRWVSTRVLPEPAPATMSSGDPACLTASACSGLRPFRRTAAPGFACRGAAALGRAGGATSESPGRGSIGAEVYSWGRTEISQDPVGPCHLAPAWHTSTREDHAGAIVLLRLRESRS